MAASSDSVVLTPTDLPVYPAGSMIRYYPTESKDEHYTVLQLKTDEVLQLKSPNPMVKKQLKFASLTAWYETLPGSPDPATFNVALGKESVCVLSKISHLKPLPEPKPPISDIYAWNRNIVRVMSEFTPHLLHDPVFVENYNTLTRLLKKYAANLVICSSFINYIEKYNPYDMLLLKPGGYHGWFENLQLMWLDDYLGRRVSPAPPVLSKVEKDTARSQITDALKACIGAVTKKLFPILLAKYKNSQAKSQLSVYTRSLKANDRALKKLGERRKWLEEYANQCTQRIRETEKVLEDAIASASVSA